jgi:hypothetical protein
MVNGKSTQFQYDYKQIKRDNSDRLKLQLNATELLELFMNNDKYDSGEDVTTVKFAYLLYINLGTQLQKRRDNIQFYNFTLFKKQSPYVNVDFGKYLAHKSNESNGNAHDPLHIKIQIHLESPNENGSNVWLLGIFLLILMLLTMYVVLHVRKHRYRHMRQLTDMHTYSDTHLLMMDEVKCVSNDDNYNQVSAMYTTHIWT